MLDDRTYMRDDPHRATWSATVILIVAIVVCFAVQCIALVYANQGRWILDYLALSTPGLKRGFIWQLFTFQFLHAGFWHLVWNGLGLWFFGKPVEERLGTTSFMKLYFLAGVAGGLFQAAAGWIAPRYYGEIPTFGASAGICGLISAFALLDPGAEIRVMCVLPVKARPFLWVSGGIAAFFTLVPMGDGYAHAAHLGGFLAGVAYLRRNLFPAPTSWSPLQGRRRKRQLVEAAAQITRWRGRRDEAGAEVPPEEFISKEVDPILDKISAHGIHSLTPRERQILEAARSKMARR